MDQPTIHYPPQIDWNATPTEQLPRLPGDLGPTPDISEAPTEVFPRVEFPPVIEYPAPKPAPKPAGGRFAGMTKQELYTHARKLKIPGRSRMTKAQLKAAIILKENAAG